jgi:hypothetical protein
VEFLSSSYFDHGHPLNNEVICICWRENRELPGIGGILSLEKYLYEKTIPVVDWAQNKSKED